MPGSPVQNDMLVQPTNPFHPSETPPVPPPVLPAWRDSRTSSLSASFPYTNLARHAARTKKSPRSQHWHGTRAKRGGAAVRLSGGPRSDYENDPISERD